ncbi:MAG: thiolase family protein [Chloroflexi bacterium]|nr:thiolase family protein [Chloroflexota bacterium]
MATETGWERNKEPLRKWEHRGKVALVGRGHSPTDRRWDGVSMDKSLGAYTILAAQRAMEDAGISPDEVDGIITCPGAQSGTVGSAAIGDSWGPVRPYFAPPYDSEDGISLVTGEWLVKQMGLKKVKYINSHGDYLWRLVAMAAQAVGDGRCSVALVTYPAGNLEGRYHQIADTTARGAAQWTNPWGWGLSVWGFVFDQYCRKYGSNHDRLAPFVVTERKNGLLVPWGYYALNRPEPFTIEDYLNGRWVAQNLNMFDCDLPVQSAACWVITTAKRAKDMKQKPVYVLDHTESQFRPRSLVQTLEENEEWTDIMARKAYAGSGLRPSDIDIFSPYDGFTTFTQYFLEAFRWRGVKRGEAHDFYAGDISIEGPNPLSPGGGNMGTGRMRTIYITDGMEQLQGRAGPRQVKIKAETYATIGILPGGACTLVFSSSPD